MSFIKLSEPMDTVGTSASHQIKDVALCLLGLSVFIFLASFFVFTSGKAVNYWFYIIVLPLTLFNLKKIDWTQLRTDWLVKWLIIFLGYCTMSACWAVDHHWTSAFKVLMQSLYIIIFFLALHLSTQLPKPLWQILLKALLWIIALSALISIIVWYTHNPLNSRLIGFFRASQSITSDWAYGIPVLVSVYYLIARPWSAANLMIGLLGLPPFVYVLLTQSRGPLVALVCGVLVLMLCYRNWRSLLLFLAFVGVILVDHTLLSRSLDTFYFREAIWQTVFQHAMQYPWFGHGYSNSIKVHTSMGDFGHAHNAYLEIFFLGGIVGFILQTVLILGILARSLRYRQHPHMYLLMSLFIFGLVALASDGNRLVVNPHELWLSFWLPLFMILSYSLNEKSRASLPK